MNIQIWAKHQPTEQKASAWGDRNSPALGEDVATEGDKGETAPGNAIVGVAWWHELRYLGEGVIKF